jgi:hypothetical protein
MVPVHIFLHGFFVGELRSFRLWRVEVPIYETCGIDSRQKIIVPIERIARAKYLREVIRSRAACKCGYISLSPSLLEESLCREGATVECVLGMIKIIVRIKKIAQAQYLRELLLSIPASQVKISLMAATQPSSWMILTASCEQNCGCILLEEILCREGATGQVCSWHDSLPGKSF